MKFKASSFPTAAQLAYCAASSKEHEISFLKILTLGMACHMPVFHGTPPPSKWCRTLGGPDPPLSEWHLVLGGRDPLPQQVQWF